LRFFVRLESFIRAKLRIAAPAYFSLEGDFERKKCLCDTFSQFIQNKREIVDFIP